MQHITTMLHGVATCVKRVGQTLAAFFNNFNAKSRCLCSPDPWHPTIGPSAHALVKQSCVSVAKWVHHITSEMLHGKFHRYEIWSNSIQHVATHHNKVAKHVVPSNVARLCVEMLQAFGQASTNTSQMIARVWLIDSKTVLDLFYSKRPRVRGMWRFSQMNAHAYMPSTLCQYLLLRTMWNKTRLKQWLWTLNCVFLQEHMRNCQIFTVLRTWKYRKEEKTGTVLHKYRNCDQNKLSRVIERDLSHRVKGLTFLSLTAGRQVSETYLTRTITGSKSLGKSFGTTLWHQVQRYCFLGIYFVHAQCRWDWIFSVYVGKISAWCHLNTKQLLVSGVSIWWWDFQLVDETLFDWDVCCFEDPSI